MPVELDEAEFLIVSARHQHIHLFLYEVDGGGTLRLRRAAGGGGRDAVGSRNEVARRICNRVVDDAVLAGEIAVGVVEVGEVEKLVFLDRAADAGTGGYAAIPEPSGRFE